VPAGSDGLLFLPYLTGERTPHPDPLARGAFVGLTVHHGRPHLTRSVLEGVAFGLRDSLELMRGIGVTGSTQIRATGGGSKSSLWRQILADALGMDVVTMSTSEGAAQGAAMLAAVGAGWYPTVQDACASTIELGDAVARSPDARRYEDAYEGYRALYPALAATFHTLDPSAEQT
jgi:xylulokinase